MIRKRGIFIEIENNSSWTLRWFHGLKMGVKQSHRDEFDYHRRIGFSGKQANGNVASARLSCFTPGTNPA
jgi:hypothetical protein